jgi:membrane-bound serine protease (ClpP class)
MSRTEPLDDSEIEMERLVQDFARGSRTPPLPDDVAALPWTVQNESRRGSFFSLVPGLGAADGLRRTAFSIVRLGATLAVAGVFLLAVSNTHAGGTGSNDIIVPQQTALPSGAVAAPDAPRVYVVKASGAVDDVMADYVSGAIRRAESDGAAAVIIQLDTLGGSEESMRRIDTALHSKIATIVWVGPPGAKAASAGTFITLSANLAYMASSTNIGAASPVSAGGRDIAATYGPTEADKVKKDAVAAIRGIAQERHPDAVVWAATTVETADSYTAQEALANKAINGIADSIDAVLAQADNLTVNTANGPVVLNLKGAAIVTVNEDFIQSFLHTLDDPNVAFVLLVLGVLLVVIELFHPTLVMGIAGALCLALAFYGSGSLPLNVLGVVLVVLGIGMIVLEPNVPSHGLLAIGGVVVFVIGAVAFYGSPGPYEPTVGVAWPIIGMMAAVAAAYGLLLIAFLMRMRRQPVPYGAGLVGIDSVVGTVGEVQADLAPTGTVYVGREAWSARTRNGSEVPRGTKVRVLGQDGLTLIVETLD